MIPLYKIIENTNSIVRESRSVVVWDSGGGGMDCKWWKVSLLLVIKASDISIIPMVSQMYTYVKTHQMVQFKYIRLIIYMVYLNKEEKCKYQREIPR